MWSSVVASFAVRPGLRNVSAATSRPSRARVVTAAAAARVVQPSSLRVDGVALVGQEVVVDPEVVGTGGVGGLERNRSDGQSVRWTQNAAPTRTGGGATRRRLGHRAMVPSGRWPAAADRLRTRRPATGPRARRRPGLVRRARPRARVPRRRATRTPILVSEVMAQQTQISRVVEAWARFLDRFPTVADLAAATPADVIRAWQGMGYDRRALNLRRAARAIVAEHGAGFRRDVAELERLPGIGPYTARAVASIAFGAPVGAVDTNVRRVLGRTLAGVDAGARRPAGSRRWPTSRSIPTGPATGRTR